MLSWYVTAPMLIISSKNARFAQVAEMLIEKLRLFARFAIRKIKVKSRCRGRASHSQCVQMTIITVIKPPIVIIGTKGTIKRLMSTPVRLVSPMKKSRIGRVPSVAPRVGSP